MESNTKSCCCNSRKPYVIACSGACDLGEVADKVARKLSAEGIRKMHCLAVVGAGIEAPMQELKNSDLLVIDGCMLDCAQKIVEKAEFDCYSRLRVSDMGFEKNNTPVDEATVTEVYQLAATMI